MGGMAAQISIKNDPAANDAALEKVRQDKIREATHGHDGTWVAHPGLVPIVLKVFDHLMPGPNQIERKRLDGHVTAADLVRAPAGTIAEEGLKMNIDVAIQYLASWLGGNGCVPIYNLPGREAPGLCGHWLLRRRAKRGGQQPNHYRGPGRQHRGSAVLDHRFDRRLCRFNG